MPNLAVPYVRPDHALQTLTRQITAAYGPPARPYEYVTGYKSATNFSGHCPDSSGIVHAVDIFVGPGQNLTVQQGIALAEALRTAQDWRASYIIHRDRIAGTMNGWQWGGSGYGHYDHIHVSICDQYWGDPAPVPASRYDNTGPWQIGGYQPLTTDFKEIDPMPTADEIARAVLRMNIQRYGQDGKTRDGITSLAAVAGNFNQTMERVLANQSAIVKQIGLAHAKENAIRSVVDQLAAGQNITIDYSAVEAAAKAGAAEALKNGVINVDVNIKNGETAE